VKSFSNEVLPNHTPEAWSPVVTWMVPMFCLVNRRVGIVSWTGAVPVAIRRISSVSAHPSYASSTTTTAFTSEPLFSRPSPFTVPAATDSEMLEASPSCWMPGWSAGGCLRTR
jgi:hypothetical protein